MVFNVARVGRLGAAIVALLLGVLLTELVALLLHDWLAKQGLLPWQSGGKWIVKIGGMSAYREQYLTGNQGQWGTAFDEKDATRFPSRAAAETAAAAADTAYSGGFYGDFEYLEV